MLCEARRVRRLLSSNIALIKKLNPAWCMIVAICAYPVAVAATGAPPAGRANAHFEPGIAVTIAIALIAGLLVLPRRLSPLHAEAPAAFVAAVAAWVAAGLGLWSGFRYLLGIAGTSDSLIVRSTGLTLAVLGIAGMVAIRIAELRYLPIWAIMACLPLFALDFPEILGAGAGGAVGLLAAALFIGVSLASYWVLRRRLQFDGYSLAFYIAAILQWIAATQIGWILALGFIGTLSSVPRLLPAAAGLVQLAVSMLLPVAYLGISGRLCLTRFLYDRAGAGASAAIVEGDARGRRTVWIISFTGVSNEPRVRRQADALIKDGWRVVVCGFDGHSPRPAPWIFIRLPATDAFPSPIFELLLRLRRIGIALAVHGWPRPLARIGALLSHWCRAYWLHIKIFVLRAAKRHPTLRPDLVIAHDYYTADIGYALARQAGAKFSIDYHEYAAEQYANDPHWRRWERPEVVAVQARYLPRAQLVTTVCDGIAALLSRDQSPRRPVLVVRNVPFADFQQFRPVGERIKVLYHGNLTHDRQLHVAVASIRLWRQEFDLVLRGDGDPAYIEELRRLAQRNGIEHRVFLEPAVAFEQIVTAANTADIGFYSYFNHSSQIEFSLPNKFFEYIMAGLAICVSNLTEVARLTHQFGLGTLIPEHKPEAIAAAINSFTRDEIERCKRNSLRASRTLNWDCEQQRLLDAYNSLFAATAPLGGSEPSARVIASAPVSASRLERQAR